LVETLKDVYILAAARWMADIFLHKFYAWPPHDLLLGKIRGFSQGSNIPFAALQQ